MSSYRTLNVSFPPAPASIGEHLSLLKHVLYNMSKMHCNFSLELCSMWRKAEFFRLLSVSFLLPPQFNFNATVTAFEYGTGRRSHSTSRRWKKKEIVDSEKELNIYIYIYVPEPSVNRATTQSKGSQHCVCQAANVLAVSCSCSSAVSAWWSVLSSLVPLELCCWLSDWWFPRHCNVSVIDGFFGSSTRAAAGPARDSLMVEPCVTV